MNSRLVAVVFGIVVGSSVAAGVPLFETPPPVQEGSWFIYDAEGEVRFFDPFTDPAPGGTDVGIATGRNDLVGVALAAPDGNRVVSLFVASDEPTLLDGPVLTAWDEFAFRYIEGDESVLVIATLDPPYGAAAFEVRHRPGSGHSFRETVAEWDAEKHVMRVPLAPAPPGVAWTKIWAEAYHVTCKNLCAADGSSDRAPDFGYGPIYR